MTPGFMGLLGKEEGALGATATLPQRSFEYIVRRVAKEKVCVVILDGNSPDLIFFIGFASQISL